MLKRFLARVRFVITQPRQAYAVLTRPRFVETEVAPGLSVKVYDSREHYITHQQEKLDRQTPEWIASYDQRYREVLRERLQRLGVVSHGTRVLCLAARLGGEVRACRDLGAFAFGIDLNPGMKNSYVVYGDFHELDFSAGSVDVVFTNSLDHALDFPRLFAEIKRVLRPDGHFVTDIVQGSAEGVQLGYYDVAVWDAISTVVGMCERAGFRVMHREEIPFPAGRECVVFQRQ